MENQSEWRAKVALACFFALVGGIFIGSLLVGLVLLGMGPDLPDLPFPIALISIPVNETIILGITLLFARYKGASLKKLGLKKASLGVLAIVSVVAVLLFLLVAGISVVEEMIFGPDPTGELVTSLMMPRDLFQRIVMIAFSLALVGPCEELAFRGFVQKSFENSFGKNGGFGDRLCPVWAPAWS
jgi:membrane protease YdiL (CAAX protease family)